MVNISRNKYLIIVLICAVALIFWSLSQREVRIIFVNEAKLMSQPHPDFCLNCPGSHVVAKIAVGESATILDEEFTKNWQILKIRIKDGSEGYIFRDVDYKRLKEGASAAARVLGL
ncbi:MAG TPA: hypothetical protein VE954_40115 [Oligoflexus sp.]|uniref:hypothetical protein n=1 Tax=Oligoflexus sp. TaxID=1971216 RepID=UPI002D2254D3|nr:hypothetical protein [Oligoflexus sp.]HYX39348.1 hypothetical protein [Oligoflexus sp.]